MKQDSAGNLARKRPWLVCAGCGKEAAQAPEGEIWAIHSSGAFCPRCARNEGLY